MIKALVTGGAGFIGSHIVDYLVEQKCQVTVLDDFSGGFQENINPEAIVFHGSVTDRRYVDSLFGLGFDYVFHCAAYAAEGLSHFIRNFNYTNNLLGSVNLINASVRQEVKCFVFLSSIAVYGSAQNPMHEDMIPNPEDPYGISKYAVELDLKAAHEMFGLDYLIFRPHNVYGERQNIGDPYRNVVGIFMNQILKEKPCTIIGDGTQTRAFTHIKDVAPIIASSVVCHEAYNQIFNIGADIPYSINELVSKVLQAMDFHMDPVYLPPRVEVQHAFSDHSKLKKFFGASPSITLEEGLQMMAVWVKEKGARKGKPFGRVEVDKGLPDYWRKEI